MVANELTNDEPGLDMWDTSPTGGPIAVRLRLPANTHFVFYREGTSDVRMDLRAAAGALPAVALNTRTGETTDLGTLEPRLYEAYDLESTSDWAIAVGDFSVPPETSPRFGQGLRLEKEGTGLVYFSYEGEPLLSFGGLSDFVFWAGPSRGDVGSGVFDVRQGVGTLRLPAFTDDLAVHLRSEQ